MMKKQLILLLLVITISSCTEKKYEWSMSISTPTEYPVVIQRGFMGKSFFGPSCVNSSWGTGIEVSKKDFFDVPDSFEITWLSLVERKFYKGKWNLPKEDIKQYLENGFNNKNKKIGFNKIQIGLAPKGMVVVWLSGDSKKQIEIGRYQGSQIILDSTDVYGSSKFMFKKDFINKKLSDPKFISLDIKETIKKHGYPSPSIYNTYREKYIWEPHIILPNGCKISEMTVRMCNGEYETGTSTLYSDQRSVPYLLKVTWKDEKEHEFISRVVFIEDKEYGQTYISKQKEEMPLNFNKNLILNQFKEKIKKNLPAKIVVKISNESVTDLYLEQEDKVYPIIKFIQETKRVLNKKPCICK